MSYDSVIATFDDIRQCDKLDKESRMTATNIMDKIIFFEFYLCLLLMKSLLFMTKTAVLELQREELDILAAIDILKKTDECLERMRQDEDSVNNLFSVAQDKCEQNGIDCKYEFSKKHRPRRPPRRLDDAPATAAVIDFETHYRKEMFRVIDRLRKEVKTIATTTSEPLAPLVCLHPKEIRKTSRREIERFCNFFPDDLDPDSLFSELDLMRSSIEQTCTLREVHNYWSANGIACLICV